MFYICAAIVVIIIGIEMLLRRRDRRLSSDRINRWLAFQIRHGIDEDPPDINP